MTKNDVANRHHFNPYQPREEPYIDTVLVEVKKRWLANPHQRLGQLVQCKAGRLSPFTISDEDWFDE